MIVSVRMNYFRLIGLFFYRYFFMVEEDNIFLLVTVIFCDVFLEWKLSFQELSEEISGEGLGKQGDRFGFRILRGWLKGL